MMRPAAHCAHGIPEDMECLRCESGEPHGELCPCEDCERGCYDADDLRWGLPAR